MKVDEFLRNVNSLEFLFDESKVNWAAHLIEFNSYSKEKQKSLLDRLPEQFKEVYFNYPGKDFLKLFDWDIYQASVYKDLYCTYQDKDFIKEIESKRIEIKIQDHLPYAKVKNFLTRINFESLLWKRWIVRPGISGYNIICRIPDLLDEDSFLRLKISYDLTTEEELRLYIRCSKEERDRIVECIDPIIPSICNNLHPLQIYYRDFDIEMLKVDVDFFQAWTLEELSSELKEIDKSYIPLYGKARYFCRKYYPGRDIDFPTGYIYYLLGDSSDFKTSTLIKHLMIEKDLPETNFMIW